MSSTGESSVLESFVMSSSSKMRLPPACVLIALNFHQGIGECTFSCAVCPDGTEDLPVPISRLIPWRISFPSRFTTRFFKGRIYDTSSKVLTLQQLSAALQILNGIYIYCYFGILKYQIKVFLFVSDL